MRAIPTVLLCLMAAAATQAERSPNLDEILAHHRAAIGTPAAAVEIQLLIEEPSFTVSADYRANRSGEMRIDVYAGEERVFTEALDADGGWQQHGGDAEPEPLSDTGRAALRRGIIANVYALHERPAHGYKLSFDGTTTIGDVPLWQITSRSPDGFEEVFYLDTGSALIVRKTERSALHPDIDATRVNRVTTLSDYRPVGGRQIAHRVQTIDADTGEVLQTTTVRRAATTPLDAAQAGALP